MTKNEVIKLGLDALELLVYDGAPKRNKEAISAMKAELTKPEPEPVAWGTLYKGGFILEVITPEEHETFAGEYTIPLYRKEDI